MSYASLLEGCLAQITIKTRRLGKHFDDEQRRRLKAVYVKIALCRRLSVLDILEWVEKRIEAGYGPEWILMELERNPNATCGRGGNGV